MQRANQKKLKKYSTIQVTIVRLSSIFLCLTLLIFITLTHTANAKAAMNPNALPPDGCLRVSISIRNVHNIPYSVGVGTAYNIVVYILNNCPRTVSNIAWNVPGNLNCSGETQLGFNENGNISSLSSGQSQTVVNNISRVAVCYTYDSTGKNIIDATPPTQETFYGSAEGSFSLNGQPVTATGSTTSYLL